MKPTNSETPTILWSSVSRNDTVLAQDLEPQTVEGQPLAANVERLAEALGKGIAKLAEKKPLVLLFDTYEIVDRPECDYTLRRVIQESGGRTQWVVAGRSNLADSGQRGSLYFRGYKRDFAETQLYAKSLSEFGLDLIQDYFAEVVTDRPLSESDAIRTRFAKS